MYAFSRSRILGSRHIQTLTTENIFRASVIDTCMHKRAHIHHVGFNQAEVQVCLLKI